MAMSCCENRSCCGLTGCSEGMARSARRSTLLCGSVAVASAAGCGVKVVDGMPARSPPAALLQPGFTQKVIFKNFFCGNKHFSRTFPVAIHPGIYNVREAVAGRLSMQT